MAEPEQQRWRDAVEIDRLRARVAELEAALGSYLFETTHLATPHTVGDHEYRRALISCASIKAARAALKEPSDAD